MNQPNEELIEATIFCEVYQVEHSFIYSLEESGLVELVVRNQQRYIPHHQLNQLEKIIRLHQQLDLNLPGVEVVLHMLDRVEQMQEKVRHLENKLKRYEE